MSAPKIYYQTEGVTLFLGDCLDVLSTLPDGDYATVFDPPYGIAYEAKHAPECTWYRSPIAGDDSTELRDAILEWAKDRECPWACFGSWKASVPAHVRGTLVWDKGPAFGMGDLSFPWKHSWELIFIGGQGWSGSRDEGVVRGPTMVTWESRGRCHPNQKPTWLVKRLLDKLPNESMIVDPTCGSGSTGVACLQTGRRFIGVEIDERFCEIAADRLRHASNESPDQLPFASVDPT